LAYLHGHSVGGTNPSLLEAMSARNVILAHDNVFNREVADDCAQYFKGSEDLARLLDSFESHRADYAALGGKAYERVESRYRWQDVVDAYHELFAGRGT
jgi:rhamnosyltransferase